MAEVRSSNLLEPIVYSFSLSIAIYMHPCNILGAINNENIGLCFAIDDKPFLFLCFFKPQNLQGIDATFFLIIRSVFDEDDP